MIENVQPRAELASFSKKQSKKYISKTFHGADVEAAKLEGWQFKGFSKNKKNAYMFKEKPKSALLESRVWTLFYRMGFGILSGRGGAQLVISPKDPLSPKTQIDCVAVDNEVGLVCECKTFLEPKKDPDFQAKISELSATRKGFADSLKKQFPLENKNSKRHIATILFTWGFELTEANLKRAEAQNVILMDEGALEYYEKLVGHMEPAARYQFLAEVFPSTQIEGLKIEGMPALKTKAGKTICYTFSMRPENLLKIAYVAHRAKGRQSDKGAYQRMCAKSRLKKIAKYISDGGNFPTNIVLNIKSGKFVRFDQGEQKGGPEGAKIGTLTLSPSYGSAWVIDGQHRLFAYSGHERAATSYLNVLAFEELSEDEQAKLFVDINHEQRSVKSNLLDELWADLHWKAKDVGTRTRAVIARAVRDLNDERQSPFFGRILLSDDTMTDRRCISLTSVTSALDKANLFTSRSKRDIVEHKALWASNNDEMLLRTKAVLNGWFRSIADKSNNWWSLGKAPGGGLSMNNGVTACINVLKDVTSHLETTHKLFDLDDHELVEVLQPYANALGTALGSWSLEKREEFRSWLGGGGQEKGTMCFNEEIHRAIPAYKPLGLKDFIDAREAGTRTQAFELISQIEGALKKTVVPILKNQFCATASSWWFSGVPKNVRKKVDDKINESDGAEGDREQNLDLIHYREIILENWDGFGKKLGTGSGNPRTQTNWIVEVNTIRKYTDHDKGRYPTVEEVKRLREIAAWLHAQAALLAQSNMPSHSPAQQPVVSVT